MAEVSIDLIANLVKLAHKQGFNSARNASSTLIKNIAELGITPTKDVVERYFEIAEHGSLQVIIDTLKGAIE